MRKKRTNSKSDIIIDLTSLLDVMFIVLLVVLCGQKNINTNLLELQNEAETAKAIAETEYKLYEEQREIADSLNSYVWAVSIVVPYDEDEITKRQIQFLKEGKEIETIDLIGNDVTLARETFKENLVRYIQGNSDRPVILSLNEEDDRILYRDEVMVNEIMNEVSIQYSNVYIKGNLGDVQ